MSMAEGRQVSILTTEERLTYRWLKGGREVGGREVSMELDGGEVDRRKGG